MQKIARRFGLIAALAATSAIGLGVSPSQATNKSIPYGVLKADTVAYGSGTTVLNGYSTLYVNVGYKFTGKLTGRLYQLTSSGSDILIGSCSRDLSGAGTGECSVRYTGARGKCYYQKTNLVGQMKLSNNGIKVADINTSVTEATVTCF